MPKALVGVADIKHAARISLHAHRIVDHVAYDAGPRLTSAVVQIGDPPDIVLRLGEAGNTGTPGHRARPGVVRRQAQLDVAPVTLQQTLQMSNPGVYVLLRIEWVRDVQRPRRAGHELHQPHGALPGD